MLITRIGHKAFFQGPSPQAAALESTQGGLLEGRGVSAGTKGRALRVQPG